MSKVSEYQKQMPELFTAEALLKFRREFRDVYGDNNPTFGAVGPMETFLGWLVHTRRIITQPQGSRRLTWRERITGKISS